MWLITQFLYTDTLDVAYLIVYTDKPDVAYHIVYTDKTRCF